MTSGKSKKIDFIYTIIYIAHTQQQTSKMTNSTVFFLEDLAIEEAPDELQIKMCMAALDMLKTFAADDQVVNELFWSTVIAVMEDGTAQQKDRADLYAQECGLRWNTNTNDWDEL